MPMMGSLQPVLGVILKSESDGVSARRPSSAECAKYRNNQLLHPKGNGTAAQKIVIDFMIRMTKEKPFLKQHGVRLLTVVAPTAQGLSNVQSQGLCS